MFDFHKILGYFYDDLAIDLGTANIVIIRDDKVIVEEPSIISFDDNGKILAVGNEALLMNGKTHKNINVIKPLKDGVIADFKSAGQMIDAFIKGARNDHFLPFKSFLNNVVIGVPSGITDVERRAVKDFADSLGASNTYTIYEPIASIIGAGIDVFDCNASMIVDIGGGTTEIAIVILGGMVCYKSVKVAGNQFTHDIIDYLQRNYGVLVGENTAESIKKNTNVVDCDQLEEMEGISICGRDTLSGIPKEVCISYDDVASAINDSICLIETAILDTLKVAPPEVSSDLNKNGIILSGGGSLLRNLDKRIEEKTKLKVRISDDPLRGVARGIGKVIKNMNLYKGILMR